MDLFPLRGLHGSEGSVHTYGYGERRCSACLAGGRTVSKRDTKSHMHREFAKTSYCPGMCVLFAKGAVIAFSLCVVPVYPVLIYP